MEPVLAALAGSQLRTKVRDVEADRGRRQRCQRLDRIVVVGRQRPRRGKADAPAEKRSDDDPPKRFRRRETPVPLGKRSEPQSSSRAHEVTSLDSSPGTHEVRVHVT